MSEQQKQKVLGAKSTCNCGTPITCEEQEYQGKKSLSWRNDDHSAHYKFNPSTKKYTCNIPSATTGQTNLDSENVIPQNVKDTEELLQIEHDVKFTLANNGIPNPDKQYIGMLMKCIWMGRHA